MINVPDLPHSEVHVWWLETDRPQPLLEEAVASLSESDCTKINRHRQHKDQYRQTQSQALLRSILHAYCKISPTQLEWENNDYGKPYLTKPEYARDLFFNLSHSENRILLAVAWNRPVGIDVELKDSEKFDPDLVQRFFSSREQNELRCFPQEEQEAAFFRGWTRKEAYVKAVGLGLQLDLSRFSVSLDFQNPHLREQQFTPKEQGIWKISNIDVGDEYVATLVAKEEDWTEKIFKFGLPL